MNEKLIKQDLVLLRDVLVEAMEEYVDNKLHREVRSEVRRAIEEELETTLKRKFNGIIQKAIEERIRTVRVIVELTDDSKV